jgi:hypothetical protein
VSRSVETLPRDRPTIAKVAPHHAHPPRRRIPPLRHGPGHRPGSEPAEASPDAIRYLEGPRSTQIEQGSRVYSTDWQALRTKALAAIAAAGARTPADTYPAIRAALGNLGDPHGRLLEPDAAKWLASRRPAKTTGLLVVPRDAIVAQVVPGSPAATAGLVVGDRIVAVEGAPDFAELPRFEFDRLLRCGQRSDRSTAPLLLSVRTGTAEPRAVPVALAAFDEYLPPTGRRLDGDIGYLELPGASGPKAADYDDAVHALLGQLDDGKLRGCIVDLRRNTGGKVEPMLASIGPLAGGGKLGAYVERPQQLPMELRRLRAERRSSRATSSPTSRSRIPCATTCRSRCSPGRSPAQAGEALVVAFAGRARTRRFGEGTRGVPVGTTTKALRRRRHARAHRDRAGRPQRHALRRRDPARRGRWRPTGPGSARRTTRSWSRPAAGCSRRTRRSEVDGAGARGGLAEARPGATAGLQFLGRRRLDCAAPRRSWCPFSIASSAPPRSPCRSPCSPPATRLYRRRSCRCNGRSPCTAEPACCRATHRPSRSPNTRPRSARRCSSVVIASPPATVRFDVCEAVVRMLEDDPHFNAGKGRGLQREGRARARRVDHGRQHAALRRGRRGAHREEPGVAGAPRDGRRRATCC